MQYATYYSDLNPWWDNESTDKPDLNYNYEIFDFKLCNYSITYEVENATFITVPMDFTPKYIKVIWTKSNRQIRIDYFFVSCEVLISSEGNKKLKLELDIYSTYTINFLKENLNEKFSISRSHNKNETKLAWQFEDPLISQLPITTKGDFLFSFNYPSEEFDFNGAESYKYSFSNNRNIIIPIWKDASKKSSNALTGNYYYVFKSFDDDLEFWAFPVLHCGKGYYSEMQSGSAVGNELVSSSSNIGMESSYQALKDNNPSKIFEMSNYRLGVSGGGGPGCSWTKPVQDNKFFNYSVSYNAQIVPGAYQHKVDVYLKYNGGTINTCSYWTNVNYPSFLTSYSGTASWSMGMELVAKPMFNDEVNLESLKNSSNDGDEAINFIGCYFLPHFGKFSDFSVYKDGTKEYVYQKIPAKGIDIFFKMPNLFFDETKKDKYDSIDINNNYFLKLYNFKYFDSFINLNQFSNNISEDNNISIPAKFYFAGNGNLILENSYEFTSNSTIIYPGALPSAVDEYSKYVAQNYSQTNTGLAHAKQDMEMEQTKSIVSGLGNALSSGSAIGAIGSMMNMGADIAASRQKYNQKKESIAASYEDAKRSITFSYAPSQIKDASYLLTHFNFGNWKTIFEYIELTDESKKIVNNIFYQFGIYYPLNLQLSEYFTRENFNYIEFNAFFLNQRIKNLSKYNVETTDKIAAQLSQGIRFWKNIPDYNLEN